MTKKKKNTTACDFGTRPVQIERRTLSSMSRHTKLPKHDNAAASGIKNEAALKKIQVKVILYQLHRILREGDVNYSNNSLQS